MAKNETKNETKTTKKDERKRYKAWTMILYPDSLPENWQDILSELHLKIWVSPLHNKDTYTGRDEQKRNTQLENWQKQLKNKDLSDEEKAKLETKIKQWKPNKKGELKKAHYHLVVCYQAVQTFDAVKSDFSELNGTQCERVRDLNSIIRYLTHQDDPKKAQYNRDDILCFGGADLDALDEYGTGELHLALKAMRKYIRRQHIFDYYLFCDLCDDLYADWARLLDTRCAYVVEKYIHSYRAANEKYEKRLDTLRNEITNEVRRRTEILRITGGDIDTRKIYREVVAEFEAMYDIEATILIDGLDKENEAR